MYRHITFTVFISMQFYCKRFFIVYFWPIISFWTLYIALIFPFFVHFALWHLLIKWMKFEPLATKTWHSLVRFDIFVSWHTSKFISFGSSQCHRKKKFFFGKAASKSLVKTWFFLFPDEKPLTFLTFLKRFPGQRWIWIVVCELQ